MIERQMGIVKRFVQIIVRLGKLDQIRLVIRTSLVV
jgi:hypothetical protein